MIEKQELSVDWSEKVIVCCHILSVLMTTPDQSSCKETENKLI